MKAPGSRKPSWWSQQELETRYLTGMLAIFGVGIITFDIWWWVTDTANAANFHLFILFCVVVLFCLFTLVSGGEMPAMAHRWVKKQFKR